MVGFSSILKDTLKQFVKLLWLGDAENVIIS